MIPTDITILTPTISVGGGIFHKQNADELVRMGITHVLNMQGEFDDGPLFEGTPVKTLWVPFHDVMSPPSGDALWMMARFIRKALKDPKNKLHAHCFLPGAVVGAKTPFLIEDISHNNVLSHTGKSRNISSRSIVPYDGIAYQIKNSSCLPIKCTPEHPFYIVRPYLMSYDKVVKPYRKYGKSGVNTKFEPFWCNAEDLQVGDYMLTSKMELDEVDIPNWDFSCHSNAKKVKDFYLDEDVAWFIGMFIANGSTTDNLHYSSICTKNNEDYLKIVKVVESFGVTTNVIFEDNYIRVNWYSVTMTQTLRKWVGKDSYSKKIPEFLYGKYFCDVIKGFVDGDGHVDRRRTTGRKFLTTTSETLAHQLWYGLVALGFRPSMNPYNRYTNLSCERAKTWGIGWTEDNKIQYNFFHNGYYCSRIKEINEIQYHGNVYNFDIEVDHSYHVNGVATHNCAAGVNRGPMAALFALSLSGMDIESAEKLIRSRRIIAGLPKVYSESIKKYLEKEEEISKKDK